MIKLGGQTFVVPPPKASRTFALQQHLIPIAGNILGAFTVIIGKNDIKDLVESEIFESLPAALPALGRIFSEMPPGELDRVNRTLLGDPKISGDEKRVAKCGDTPLFGMKGEDPYDEIMAGRTIDMWRLTIHALEAWYPDFFGLVQPFVERVKKASLSKASTTSATNGPGAASSSSATSSSQT